MFTFLGLLMIITELACYIVLFRHIAHHNNQIMTGMLDPKVIAMRNHVNAVTLKGTIHITLILVLSITDDCSDCINEQNIYTHF